MRAPFSCKYLGCQWPEVARRWRSHMDEQNQAANTGAGAPEGIATPTATTDPIVSTSAEPASLGETGTSAPPAANQQPDGALQQPTGSSAATGDITETQKFAHRLKEESSKAAQAARDAVYNELYGAQGVTSEAEYKRQVERQRLMEEGKDPELYMKLNSLETELKTYRQNDTFQRQDTSLRADPVRGEFYKQWESEVRSSAAAWNCDLQSAFTVMLNQRLPDILSGQATKAEQAAINKMLQNTQSTPGALAAPPADKPASYAEMSDADFEALHERAVRGDLRKS